MTCATMGGPCDVKVTAATENEMSDKGWDHLMKMHPEMVEKMNNMTPEEKNAWRANFHTTWEAALEDEAAA